MELLEFKNKIFSLFGISDIKELGGKLLEVVLQNDSAKYDQYAGIIDGSRDWIQALWQYYAADREEMKQDFTPKSLCSLVSQLAGDCRSVYDCCGGCGALSIKMMSDWNIENIYVEELDERVIPFLLFNLCFHNANGLVVNCDALTRKHIMCYILENGKRYSTCKTVDKVDFASADVSISNPPYNIKWNAPSPIEAIADGRFPILPPASNANFAFVFNCLARASGRIVMILPCGIMSARTEYDCRKFLVDSDIVESVIVMPDKMFEVTSISTCILVIDKNKANTGEICFIDSRKNCAVTEREQNGQFGGNSHTNRTYKKAYNVLTDEHINNILTSISEWSNKRGFSAIVKNQTVAENEYLLTPSRYIEFEQLDNKHRDFNGIAKNINYITRMRNACKLIINETIAKRLGLDIETFKHGNEISENLNEQMKKLGIDMMVDDYIKFTRNNNEFVFKCNDKEMLPDILLQFFTVWKNQIALLNTMQNQYFAELRDALLPDLMSGKIEINGGNISLMPMPSTPERGKTEE